MTCDAERIAVAIIGISAICDASVNVVHVLGNEDDKFRFDTDKAGDKFVGKFIPRKYEDILLGSDPSG